MSDKLPYYCVHDNYKILGFFGEYRWLSNFWKLNTEVWYDGYRYLYVENAYQAAKVHRDYRAPFFNCSPGESKKIWRQENMLKLHTPEQWDSIKYDIMCGLVFQKFLHNLDLRQKLLDTGDKYLQERNNWKDCFFGYDDKIGGENKLGEILMKVRTFWKRV